MSLISLLSGGASIDGQKYLDSQPPFDLREYFNGPIKAWGIVQDRKGNIIRRFDIDMVGAWRGDEGELTEDFSYYDGEVQRRVWRIKHLGNAHYEGRADDIVGKALGRIFGNAGQWRYVMEVPVGNRTIRLCFDDWMWAMNDGVLMNRSYMKKFGIKVAEITILMKKP